MNFLRITAVFAAAFCLSAAAAAEEFNGKVYARILNIRSGAGTDNPVVAKVRSGDVLKVKGEKDGWYQVELADGKSGFASSRYIRKTDEPAGQKSNAENKTGNVKQPDTAKNSEQNTKSDDEVKIKNSSSSEAEFLKKYQLEKGAGKDITVTGMLMDNGPESDPRYLLLKEVKGKYEVDYYLDIPGAFKCPDKLRKARIVGDAYQVTGWKRKLVRVRKVVFLQE